MLQPRSLLGLALACGLGALAATALPPGWTPVSGDLGAYPAVLICR